MLKTLIFSLPLLFVIPSIAKEGKKGQSLEQALYESSQDRDRTIAQFRRKYIKVDADLFPEIDGETTPMRAISNVKKKKRKTQVEVD